MIFVTVGTQLPFDRLIRAVDCWAEQNRQTDVFAQIGRGRFEPAVIEWVRFLSPEEVNRQICLADTVVAHAGVGTIMAALQFRKPIIVFPRYADLSEHRNNHQVATAHRFGERGLVRIAEDEATLNETLSTCGDMELGSGVEAAANERLASFLSEFLRVR